jgi:hypothetical protein
MHKEIWVYSNFHIEALKLLAQELGITIRSLIERTYGTCAEIQVQVEFEGEKYKVELFEKFLNYLDYNSDRYNFSIIAPKRSSKTIFIGKSR